MTGTTTVGSEHKSGVLIANSYGKSRVRLTKVIRQKDRHILKEISVDIQLEGEFARAYTDGDNKDVVATDSMKNTVYVIASSHALEDIESFGKSLAQHFVTTYKQVKKASVHLAEELWQRILVDEKPHPHAFFGAGDEKHVAQIVATAASVDVESGIENLQLVKTTDSEFWGFVRDKYTTLPETKDRIFGTAASVNWLYAKEPASYQKVFDTVRNTVLEVFATHHSLGVQHTMHEIGQIALERVPELREISLAMPNQHRIPFNLQPLGLENKNEIFITTDEPYGLISATVKRS
jgi:urate oxidase